MATYHGITAVGQAILSILGEACPKPEFAGAEFKLYHATSFKTPITQGVSLFLYRVTVNANVRNLQPRLGNDGLYYRPSLPLDLHYLLNVWWPDAAKLQRLLGWCMRELEDMPILSHIVLNHSGPEPGIFEEAETVELTLEELSLQDLANITDAFKGNLQICVPYVARMVRVDSMILMDEGGVVQTREFGVGKLLTI